MPTTLTLSSDSERVVVYPEGTKRAAPTPPVHSPTSSESRSFSSSANSEDWIEVPYVDDIEPSDSASRSRHPSSSRRHAPEARPAAPSRRHSSRRVAHADELPRRSSHRHTVSDHPRRRHTESRRRVPSDESASTVSSHDDYPYGHHGAPLRQPPPGFRHVAAASHGGYPPSMTSAVPGYGHDPFNPQALVHLPQNDPFGYPSGNPFQPPPGHANPFSPLSSAGSAANGYFPSEAMAPPHMPPHGRPHGQSRPQSYAAPPSGYGSELMQTPYGYGAHFPPYGMPGYPPYPPHMYPPSHTPTPPAAPAPSKEEEKPAKKDSEEINALKALIQKHEDERVAREKPAKQDSAEINALKAMIQKHEEESVAREKAMIAKLEAEAAAVAAAKVREEQEKRRREEIAEAAKKAKEAAEKEAAEKAKKAKEESDKKIEEAKKAKEAAQKEAEEKAKKAKEESDKQIEDAKKAMEEVEKAKKALEAEMEKNKPTPDSLKAPIKFKDAVGRKFSFPWHLCKSWKGMENLIRQAFLHVDVIGHHVQEGHYDLTGPDGEIILPQVWETMIQPDWEISMHMWPMPEHDKKEDKLAADVMAMTDPLAQFGLDDFVMDVGGGGVPKPKKKKGDKAAKKAKAGSPNNIVNVGPAGPSATNGGIPVPPPLGFPPSFPGMPPFPPGMPPFPPGMDPMVMDMPPMPGFDMGPPPKKSSSSSSRPKAKSKSSKELPFLATWMAGSSRQSKKGDEKLALVRSHSHKESDAPAACAVM